MDARPVDVDVICKKLYAPEHINIMHDVAVFTNVHK